MKQFRNIYIASVVLFVIFIIGIIGFIKIEGYTFVEAVYMTVITISTVGFGEVRKLSETGMIFTVVLIGVSLGIFGYLITTLTRIFLDGEYRKFIKLYAVNKKVKKIKNHVIVCGFGRNGRQATIDLLKTGEKVVVIERSQNVMDDDINDFLLKKKNLVFIQGDASHDEALEKASIRKAKALITTLPNDGENLLIVLTAKDLGNNITIISRASDEHSYSKLKRAGADNVIMPDIVGGTRMAKLVTEPDIIEFLEMIMIHDDTKVHIEEISCSNMATCFIDKKLSELDMRKKTGANLIGLKLGSGKYIFNPKPDITLKTGDKLFVLGTPEEIRILKEALIADDYFDY